MGWSCQLPILQTPYQVSKRPAQTAAYDAVHVCHTQRRRSLERAVASGPRYQRARMLPQCRIPTGRVPSIAIGVRGAQARIENNPEHLRKIKTPVESTAADFTGGALGYACCDNRNASYPGRRRTDRRSETRNDLVRLASELKLSFRETRAWKALERPQCTRVEERLALRFPPCDLWPHEVTTARARAPGRIICSRSLTSVAASLACTTEKCPSMSN